MNRPLFQVGRLLLIFGRHLQHRIDGTGIREAFREPPAAPRLSAKEFPVLVHMVDPFECAEGARR